MLRLQLMDCVQEYHLIYHSGERGPSLLNPIEPDQTGSKYLFVDQVLDFSLLVQLRCVRVYPRVLPRIHRQASMYPPHPPRVQTP